jgi:hypothetical protein
VYLVPINRVCRWNFRWNIIYWKKQNKLPTIWMYVLYKVQSTTKNYLNIQIFWCVMSCWTSPLGIKTILLPLQDQPVQVQSLLDCWTPKMKALRSLQTSWNTRLAELRLILYNLNLQQQRCVNLKSQIIIVFADSFRILQSENVSDD